MKNICNLRVKSGTMNSRPVLDAQLDAIRNNMSVHVDKLIRICFYHGDESRAQDISRASTIIQNDIQNDDDEIYN